MPMLISLALNSFAHKMCEDTELQENPLQHVISRRLTLNAMRLNRSPMTEPVDPWNLISKYAKIQSPVDELKDPFFSSREPTEDKAKLK